MSGNYGGDWKKKISESVKKSDYFKNIEIESQKKNLKIVKISQINFKKQIK